jgi:hypothetical protein
VKLRVLHDYSEQVEQHFRHLLNRVIDTVEGTFTVPAYTDPKPSREADRIIRKMSKSFQA